MPEFHFDLEQSAYFKKRSELLTNNKTPKLSDAKANLGDTLSKVVFEQCEEALRDDFGLSMPLKGPGNLLWISPSDLLIGKIALKPPFTPKCLQALTHKGILEIGEALENKFRAEMELDKLKALEKYKNELLAALEDRMKSEIKDVEIRERLACHIEMEKLQQEFEITLKEELDKLETKIREQYEEIIANHESTLKEKWEDKLQKEVKKTAESMTKEYLAQLDEQEDRLTKIFALEMKKQEALRDFDANMHKRKTVEALRQLKHNLECTNLVNMMYVLCSERQKCCDQKAQIESHYKNEIKCLEDRIQQKDNLIAKVTSEKVKTIKEVSVREKCLLEVIKHFQKFINFALRAAPTQAEFLLSVEKMMVFELTNEIAKSELPKSRDAPLIIPWRHEGISATPSLQVSSLEIRDYHDCLRELNPPIKEDGSELGENDILPAIYFKNKTYVREDFRDMLSGGVKLTPSNELWNKDVEILVNNWREQYSDSPKAAAADFFGKDSIDDPTDYCIPLLDKLDLDTAMQADRRRSNKSAVQFSTHGSRNGRRSIDSRKISIKGSLKPTSFTFVENMNVEAYNVAKSQSTILAAKDSLEVHIEKMKKQKESIQGEMMFEKGARSETVEKRPSFSSVSKDRQSLQSGQDRELVVETKDSVIMRLSEMAKTQSSEFTASPNDSLDLTKELIEIKEVETKPRLSRLTLARNSVEMLRESLHRLREPSIVCQRKDTKRRGDENIPSIFTFAGTCCDRCKRKEEGIEKVASDPTRESIVFKADSIGDGDERSVRISRIQIINLDNHVRTSNVSFKREPLLLKKDTTTYKTTPSPTVETSRSTASSKRSSRKKVKRKKEPIFQCSVFGDKAAEEGDQTSREFTADRIHSLVKLMRDQPHLMQLFTAGLR